MWKKLYHLGYLNTYFCRFFVKNTVEHGSYDITRDRPKNFGSSVLSDKNATVYTIFFPIFRNLSRLIRHLTKCCIATKLVRVLMGVKLFGIQDTTKSKNQRTIAVCVELKFESIIVFDCSHFVEKKCRMNHSKNALGTIKNMSDLGSSMLSYEP